VGFIKTRKQGILSAQGSPGEVFGSPGEVCSPRLAQKAKISLVSARPGSPKLARRVLQDSISLLFVLMIPESFLSRFRCRLFLWLAIEEYLK
jgi:hypothetical protein